jgi:hypothetical protein
MAAAKDLSRTNNRTNNSEQQQDEQQQRTIARIGCGIVTADHVRREAS